MEGQKDTKPVLYTGSIPPVGGQNNLGSGASSMNGPPEHLAEFYSFMNNKSNISISPQHSPNIRDFSVSNKQRVTRQPSLNTFTSFMPSVMDLPNILSSKDFEKSIDTYQNMLNKAEKFQKALMIVSEAANDFGQALENTIDMNPKVNNSKEVSDGLINAGSLQYIVGSNNQILSRLLKSNFLEPLQQELDNLKLNYKSNYEYHQREVQSKSRLLRAKELENLKLSKSKTRNLTVYKNNLVNLTNQLDEIDRLKYDYYHEVNLMMENFNESNLLIRTGSIIRAELELFEGIARKGWSGGGLDKLLEISPDLFALNENEPTTDFGIAMEDIEEDNESVESEEINETLATVKQRSPHTRSTSNIDQIDVSTPKVDNESLKMDESFSLPKINGNSLVNSGKSEEINNDNVLGELDSRT